MSIESPRIADEWRYTGFLGLTAALALTVSPFTLLWRSQTMVAGVAALMAVVAWVYYRWRPEPRLTRFAQTGLRYVVATNSLAVLGYVLTGLSPIPLLDPPLARFDTMLGLDWRAYHDWFYGNANLAMLGKLFYNALGPELIALMIALDLMGRHERAIELFLAFAVSAFAVTLIGAAVPAAGSFVHYATAEAQTEPYVRHYLALRAGGLREIDLLQIQGLVQFPSFHAALALLCVHAVRGIPTLFWLLAILNAGVILATPPFGGHHFVDVLAGLILAIAVIIWLRRRTNPAQGQVLLHPQGPGY